MEDGLEHLAGTGSRVSLNRLRERPFPYEERAPTRNPGMAEYREKQEALRQYRERQQERGGSCKAMTRDCMGDEAYDEYNRRKLGRPPPKRLTGK